MASRSIVTKENLSTDFYIDADKWPACLFVNFSTQFYRGTDGKIYVSSIGGGGGDFLDNLVVAPDYVMRPTAVGNEGGKSSMAAGNGASAAEEAIAFGSDASAASGAVAVGTGAVAGTYASAAYGRNATASGAESVAIGDTATALGALSTAIGYSASASANGYGVALGPMAHADGAQGIAIGMSAGATGSGAIAIGTGGSAAENAVMIGAGSAGQYSVVAGSGANGSGQSGVAIGQSSAIGTASYAVVVGAMAAADADHVCAIGASSAAGADGSMALGHGSMAYFKASVALGSMSKTYSAYEVSFGRDAQGSDAAIYRRLSHVANATNDHDAVNLGQVMDLLPSAGSGTSFDAVPGWRGATVKVDANISVTAANYAVLWQSASEDTDAFWNSAVDAKIFTVPAGVNKVRLSWALFSSDAGDFASSANIAIRVNHNSDIVAYSGAKVGYSNIIPSSAGCTPVLDVAEGDTLKITIVSSDTNYTLSAGSMFQIEVVDPIPVPKTVVLADGSASLTLEYALAGRVIESTSSAAVTYTIAADPDDAIPVGTMFTFAQNGAGAINVTAASGVTLNGVDGASGATRGQWGSAFAYKTATNAWVFHADAFPMTASDIRAALDALIGTAWRKVSLQSSTAAYALTDADLAGNVIRTLTSATAVTLTVPAGLTGTEPMTIIQGGAGTVTITAASGVTIKSFGSATALAGEEAWATLIPLGSDTYRLGGNIR